MKNDDQKAIFANAKVNDVLVEVEAASICGTDVHVLGNLLDLLEQREVSLDMSV